MTSRQVHKRMVRASTTRQGENTPQTEFSTKKSSRKGKGGIERPVCRRRANDARSSTTRATVDMYERSTWTRGPSTSESSSSLHKRRIVVVRITHAQQQSRHSTIWMAFRLINLTTELRVQRVRNQGSEN